MYRCLLRLLALFTVMGGPSIALAQVAIPNTFADGTPALADEVNANFQALANGINSSNCATPADVVCNPSFNCPAVPDCGSSDFYNQGFSAGAASADLTADNEALCTASGGVYNAQANTCTVDLTTDNEALCTASGGVYNAQANACTVDLTTDNEALCTASGGVYNAQANTCTVDLTPDNEAVCLAGGGAWDGATSTCSPGSSDDCFVGGYCAQAALNFPPGDYGYVNAFAGAAPNTGSEPGGSCSDSPSGDWAQGATYLDNVVSPPPPFIGRFLAQVCQ